MAAIKQSARFRERSALALMEEAIRLLRGAPAVVLVAHLLGSAPCLLYALYFFTDLSRSAFASGHVVGEALTLAILYLWMKSWQAVSLAYLRAELLREPPPRWDAERLVRLVAAQALLQPIGLLLRFVASALLIPYVWVATFFQNVTVLGDGSPAGVRTLCIDAWAEARRWPKQAHSLAGWLTVFGLFVFINFVSLAAVVPMLLKSFLGIETVFTHYLSGLFNPTVVAAMLALTYLVLDPIRKAAVALRCFQGRSLRTGADLAVEMKSIRRIPVSAAAAVVLLLFGCGPLTSTARAEEPRTRVDSAELNRSIDEVLDRSEFTWRAPREKENGADLKQMNVFEKWMRDLKAWRERVTWDLSQSIGRVFRRLIHWLFGRDGDRSHRGGSSSWLNSAQVLLWLVAIAAAAILAVLIARRWRRPLSLPAQAETIQSAPDLREENVTADQLPEDGWLQLARELLDRGELRLALRAFYLAGLAHLGSRELIRLAKHKTDRDYDRELRRRARTQAELLGAFDRNLEAFERAWYGDHPVTREGLGEFSVNLERIRAC